MPLFLAPTNCDLRVTHIGGTDKIVGHLASLGIVEEEIIRVLSHEAGGVIVRVEESRLALDHDIAKGILVAII